MKNKKTLLSALLVLVMVLSLAITAFAAETGSITVENPKTGETYTAYKIFDVVYSEDQTAYSYTIDSGSEWYDAVSAYQGVTLEQVTDTTTYNVVKNEKYSAAAFAAALDSAVAGKTGIELTVSDGKATATGLELGYYFVTTATGALCNLTTADPAASIYDKNDVPFEKTDDDESVYVGQKVNYDITAKVPDATGFSAFTYRITDTMSAGLTFHGDVTVKVGGTVLDSSLYTLSENAAGFVLTIDVMGLQSQVGAEILVEYSATVNENAVAKIEKNRAVLEYSNDPTDSTEITATPADEETVYTAKIVIDKYQFGAEDKKLADAKFVLYKEAGNVRKYYRYDETLKQVSWVDAEADATVKTTDENGAAEFIGLEDGSYKLHETQAPAGYNLLKDDVTVTINGAGAAEANLSSLTVEAGIANNTGSQLPETGGMGTMLFYIVGGLLMMAAVILLVVKKRSSTAE